MGFGPNIYHISYVGGCVFFRLALPVSFPQVGFGLKGLSVGVQESGGLGRANLQQNPGPSYCNPLKGIICEAPTGKHASRLS